MYAIAHRENLLQSLIEVGEEIDGNPTRKATRLLGNYQPAEYDLHFESFEVVYPRYLSPYVDADTMFESAAGIVTLSAGIMLPDMDEQVYGQSLGKEVISGTDWMFASRRGFMQLVSRALDGVGYTFSADLERVAGGGYRPGLLAEYIDNGWYSIELVYESELEWRAVIKNTFDFSTGDRGRNKVPIASEDVIADMEYVFETHSPSMTREEYFQHSILTKWMVNEVDLTYTDAAKQATQEF